MRDSPQAALVAQWSSLDATVKRAVRERLLTTLRAPVSFTDARRRGSG